jgi:hypothetical protein
MQASNRAETTIDTHQGGPCQSHTYYYTITSDQSINDSHIATCNDELRKKKGQDKKKRRSIPPNWEFF